MAGSRAESESAGGSGDGSPRTLGPTAAGTWYTEEPRALARQIDGLLDQGREGADPTRPVRALIAPHAGLAYSGPVAGRGFAWLRERRFERVVLMGPSHHAAFAGAALPQATVYRTPLGDTPIDARVIETLSGRPGIRIDDGPFRPEHCLESEILFLQRALGAGWRLLPLLIGAGTTSKDAESVARAIREWVTAETLIVVSTDFTHFGPQFRYVPFEDRVPERIEGLDMGAVDRILAVDPGGFADYVDRTGATICGRDAIGVLLRLLPREVRGSLVAYDTSGRMTGSWDHTVSYASVVFEDPEREPGAPCPS